jgi:hypothetical protein
MNQAKIAMRCARNQTKALASRVGSSPHGTMAIRSLVYTPMINTILSQTTVAGATGKLKTRAVIFVALTLLTATGCRTTNVSSEGGVVTLDEQFSITVPAETTLKQGTETPINVVLNRGPYFKRDVQLDIRTEGINVTPNSVLVKASDSPEVQLQIAASREAALGEYRVTVTGTPTTGKPAVTLFIVRVIAQ